MQGRWGRGAFLLAKTLSSLRRNLKIPDLGSWILRTRSQHPARAIAPTEQSADSAFTSRSGILRGRDKGSDEDNLAQRRNELRNVPPAA